MCDLQEPVQQSKSSAFTYQALACELSAHLSQTDRAPHDAGYYSSAVTATGAVIDSLASPLASRASHVYHVEATRERQNQQRTRELASGLG